MRLLSALLIIFAAIVALGFWTNHRLQVSSGELMSNIEQIEQRLESNQWNEAYEQTAELEKSWENKAKWWPTVLDHQEIDNIEFSMAKIKEYIARKDIALSWGQLAELKLMVNHIPEKEAIRLKNVL
ncbi:MAG: hypothetical protein A4E52_01413 [Pelotomaculum sp. PtaB.Bin013]|uniref:DUF4363 family protein n=1 Tax=Pelotomaculum isophthalicicum JI TaxID=947010 RepID=A0A9X4JW44_9FIRM|nr:DUF4363 family protein [Pelotomaculum isophthalicicum]MDF9408458.1 DUF4363 family protein [Pelotomaculum isophthalicicum JI]OPX87219.1 MAG: hypothetical protein A4E52_01413 [Pelotomaculum sp. PtaB.Bin013]